MNLIFKEAQGWEVSGSEAEITFDAMDF
jgi:rubredoxin